MTEDSQTEDKETLITHIEALRDTLLKCFTSLAIILPFTFYLAPKALDKLIEILIGENKVMLNYFSPIEVFLLQIKTALVLAIMICFPYIAKQVWNFVLPALYENEKKFIKSIVFLSSFLFVLGMLFCLLMILPMIVRFGLSFSTNNIQPVFGISNIVTLSLWLSLVFGLMFQMPLITFSLIKSGFVEYKTLSDKRPYVIVGILTVAAILTPPDIVSQVMLFVPTYLLFELGLLFSKSCKKKIQN